ncbi:BREX-1 system adenine-specific DNA-methyltransferase PglX [Bradyrhizobium diazoefficiens]|uniref:site-specific DNA-methyltransferase (adenine-specific) n=2 Tax=Bradyrhizobium diazoefficiens TaxID=1355477 RepID=A0A837CFR0_9BRAD|nr:DNA methyltransferase [Bradyrhizobium diazoefficiens]APO55355.1 hypothetical protein BD122_33750 [Bradyrhizobium diazoefficiens]KGJ68154.1 hypothetical protein BJA5080_00948 [Bradyrhizobium diazoefficiens SEMIA 5080]KOY04868.1 hypothetical protein AF336_39675 [Bradyrhizobium diazoefficiens]MCD9298001.1 BREX-1 system adenine-specific DNA-methyltransferase PglX [Bradyrhizobium diazoefficiens]MCD9815534.1 BREX-1 system adenine-specific DNA-methyltransferase PglX [Bradyrhizobium diazoefficiens]
MSVIDPNAEWIGNVQPTGLVVAANVLAGHGLNPAEQTRADSETVRALLSDGEDGPALVDPWSFFAQVLGWREAQVAGTVNGPAVPADLSIRIEESAADLAPHWAVTDPDTGWQLLVRLEDAGVEPDQRGALRDWEATPHQQLERLLRETGVPAGLLLTDNELRIVHAPRGETSGWLKFPLRSLGEVGGRPMLGGLKLILSSFRLHNDAPNRRLTGLLKESREAQAEVSTKLAAQVLGALHELLRGLHSADRSRIETLAASRPGHLYEGLLTALLRLVFLLYAEDRDLIPSRVDGEARALYDQGYGVRSLYSRLLDDAARYPDTMDERRGAWARLLALFRLVHRGDSTGWIKGRGGKLFDPDAFPFLQGQDTPIAPPAPAIVSDGSILRILDLLLNLDGEQLSYRTLDVEQIGSVYETVMGFTVETLAGPAIAIRAGKNDRTPVFVDLAALAGRKGSERAKFLKENADRNSISDRVARSLAAAVDIAGVVAALLPIVDERGSPGGQLASPGTPLLQPTDERRRTGSHYTPRSLTGPIVSHALEPAFERIGADAKPEQILDLKVCDPAMGSGAFLVEACRTLAARMVKAWERWPETKPAIPPDEDADLHAKRLVAQRCLYGVDKNPLATDLAKLSLWLATLARDHEFTFLDHALKTGDSLVGLTQVQIAAVHWDTSKSSLPLFRQLVQDRVAEAMRDRSEIQAAPDDTARAIQEQRHRSLELRLEKIRLMGDAVIAAFFAEDKPRARERKRAELESWLCASPVAWEKIAAFAATLKQGAHPVRPFHWEIEFPEVLARKNGGFDAIVGNPPFAGKNTLAAGHRAGYGVWLQTLHQRAHGNADLVAHFFRRAFELLRQGGLSGLIATNTIGQGDTRSTGLTVILKHGGAIVRAVRRLKWPGEAAVVVSVVHVSKDVSKQPILDGRPVRRISAYLVEGDLDTSPSCLAANASKAFVGSYVSGAGFTFDDSAAAKNEAESLRTMQELIGNDPRNAQRVFPYIGGEEVNNDPQHSHRRYVINFFDFPLRREHSEISWAAMSDEQRNECRRSGIVPNDYADPVAADWPNLLSIVERRVKPQRAKDKREPRRRRWWRYAETAPGLYAAIAPLGRVLVRSLTSTQFPTFTFVPSRLVYDQTLICWCVDTHSPQSVLASRTHEIWTRFLGATMKDDSRYNIGDCFETFPFPLDFESSPALDRAGRIYHEHRSALMVSRNEGMTKIYNRFQDPAETGEDIQRLRELHAAMDRAVLEAYGWNDLAESAAPIFLDKNSEDDHAYQGRLFWPSEFRDEVLARLLALNAERHSEEVSLGTAPEMKGNARQDEDAELEDVE